MGNYIDRMKAVTSDLWSDATCPAQVLMSLPAADVVPVRHGKWVKEEPDFYYECSECGGKWHEQWIRSKFLKYCPDCGCKMDLEAADET